jgi:hypothetical protein
MALPSMRGQGIQVGTMIKTVSFSELTTARQCPLKHELAYVERWSKEPARDSPLTKGTLWHAVLEIHYNTIREFQQSGGFTIGNGVTGTLGTAAGRVERFLEDVDEDLADLIWWMYQGHVELYGADEGWKILAVEHNAVCRLPTASGRASQFELKIKIDLIVADITRRKAQIWVVDHKSGKNLPGKKELDLDDQFGLYTWGLRSMGRKVFGQIHSAARTTRNLGDFPEKVDTWSLKKAAGEKAGAKPKTQTLEERFQRTLMAKTDIELDSIAREAYQTARSRYAEQADIERARKRAANQGKSLQNIEPPRHTDTDTCRWKCDYTEQCLAGRKGIEMRPFLYDVGFRQNFERH